MDKVTSQANVESERTVQIETGDVQISGDLVVPDGALGVVLFAHGSGSSRHSPRNRQVAAVFQRSGLATLLIDLLTAEEDAIDQQLATLRFDIPMLGYRLPTGALGLARPRRGATANLPAGLFGRALGVGRRTSDACPDRSGARDRLPRGAAVISPTRR